MVIVPAARMTRQNIEYLNYKLYYPLGVSIRHDLYMIQLMFPKIPTNKAVNLWFNPNGVLLPLRELLNAHEQQPSLIGQKSYSKFVDQIQVRIPKTMAVKLIEQFWGKVVQDKMYRKSTNGKRVLYSERMFEVRTIFFNRVKGDDTN